MSIAAPYVSNILPGFNSMTVKKLVLSDVLAGTNLYLHHLIENNHYKILFDRHRRILKDVIYHHLFPSDN
jgi:hypothetical protein